ncbi:zinc finger protein ZIC 5-like [Bacillus rossius redtenbacheri]|uniref:zinc finger protein ZIC 5-like n=1 Tax=Bacillus rossius redtenbacheri TaxID=93214 RepID=UPI002FDCE424
MRRASYTPLPQQSEPLIVVEESGATDDEDSGSGPSPGNPPSGLEVEGSPLLNPELLSPYRDMRKRSLPTPQCTSGITASQVRRLSEHGADPGAAGGREAAFLATLSSTPAPESGGRRRHSVVTISRAPPTSIMFGRGRRESIAVFPSAAAGAGGGCCRVLPPRRDSCSAVPPPPPSTASTAAGGGSTFNLQLDIMDDIAEIKAARKVRLKMWQAPGGQEKMCEVQPLDAGAASTRYHQQPPPQAGPSCDAARRYSDFAATLAAPAVPPRRRASELAPASGAASPAAPGGAAGIVCSNTDLISILSSLATSAQEISREPEPAAAPPPPPPARRPSAAPGDQKHKQLKDLRSNSFDVSMLLAGGGKAAAAAAAKAGAAAPSPAPANWFAKRHQPRKASADAALLQRPAKSPVLVTFKDDPAAEPAEPPPEAEPPPVDRRVVWDGKSGSVVDAQVLGSAIEVFLARRGSGGGGESPPPPGSSPGEWSGKPVREELG